LSEEISVSVVQAIATVGRADWDACANPRRGEPAEIIHAPGAEAAAPAPDLERYNPFISYDFLHALETSGCVGGRSGWSEPS